MDGIGLELWNKKLLQARYKRQRDFRACAELSLTHREYSVQPLSNTLFESAADNLDLLVLYWKETFLGSWQRQKPTEPDLAAGQARGEIETVLTTEQHQIENEIQALATTRNLEWPDEEIKSGKTHLSSRISLLRASCIAYIADLRIARVEELDHQAQRDTTHRRELGITWGVLGTFVLASALSGVWLGAFLKAKYSREDRLFIDQRMSRLMMKQNQAQEQLSNLHRSNRKIAFWTEKTPGQIDREMAEIQERLKAELQDIRSETAKKIGLIESEYARSGREGGTELSDRRNNLLKIQEKLFQDAQDRAQKKLEDLTEQKTQIQR